MGSSGGARATLLLAAVAAAIGASCAAAPVDEGTQRVAQSIIGGDADVTDVAVVAVQQTSTGTLCSGTLVAPAVVLTAAHCLYGVAASDLQVLVGDQVSAPAQTVAASSVVVYPTYTGESTGLAGGVDLGVVVLAQPLPVAPVPVDTTSTDAELAGATVTLVGYGVSSTTDGTQVGVRRSVSTPVTAVCSRTLTLGNASANECFGDSGGAALLGGRLVAVISSGLADCIAPSTQTRLSAHATWIANVVAGSPSAPCPTCVSPDPSCGAATETAGAMSDEAGPSEAGATAIASGGHGGCTLAPAATDHGDALSFVASLLLLSGVARDRRRLLSSTAPSSPRPPPLASRSPRASRR